MFLARSGRTGPARPRGQGVPAFAHRPVHPHPGAGRGGPGPQRQPSPWGCPRQLPACSRSKEGHPRGTLCALGRPAPTDSADPAWPWPRSSLPPRPKQETSPRPGPGSAAGASAGAFTPTPHCYHPMWPQAPASSRGRASWAPNKHSAPRPPQSQQIQPQPQGQPHGKGDGGTPTLPGSPPRLGSRGPAALRAFHPPRTLVKQEPASEGPLPEKRWTSSASSRHTSRRTLASLPELGASSPVLERRGELRSRLLPAPGPQGAPRIPGTSGSPRLPAPSTSAEPPPTWTSGSPHPPGPQGAPTCPHPGLQREPPPRDLREPPTP